MQGFEAKKKKIGVDSSLAHLALPAGDEPGCVDNSLSDVTIRLRSMHHPRGKMYLNQVYEKGNVSIRKEKKHRECSIRQVTSNIKSNVKEIGIKVSINYDKTNLMLILNLTVTLKYSVFLGPN